MLLRGLGVRRQVIPRDDAVDILRGRACPGDPVPNRNHIRLRGTAIGTRIGHENMWFVSSCVCRMHGSGPTLCMKDMPALETAAHIAVLESTCADGAHIVVVKDDRRWLHRRR